MQNIRKNKKKLVISLLVCGMFIAVSLSGVMAKPPSEKDEKDGDWMFTSDSGDMYAIPDGNIGIGTDSPDYKLDIVGDRIRLNESNNPGSKTIDIRTDGTHVDVNANNADLFLHSWTGNTILQYFGGNVGIGVWEPLDKLHVSGGHIRIDYPDGLNIMTSNDNTIEIATLGNDLTISNRATGDITFWTGTTEGVASKRLCITNEGDVGIGANIPSAKLHVNGNNIAVRGQSTSGTGVNGDSTFGIGVEGYSEFGTAIYGWTDTGLAAEFTGNVKIDGGVYMPLTKISADYNVLQSDYTIIADGTSSIDFTINLPPASDSPGKILIIKRTGPPIPTGRNVHIHPAGYGTATPDYLEGVGFYYSMTITQPYSFTFQSDGINVWYLISQSPGL